MVTQPVSGAARMRNLSQPLIIVVTMSDCFIVRWLRWRKQRKSRQVRKRPARDWSEEGAGASYTGPGELNELLKIRNANNEIAKHF